MYQVETDSWLVPVGDGARGAATLLCMPYAGAGAQAFRPLAAALPGIRVIAVELPGRGRRVREPAATSLGPLADAIAEAVLDSVADAGPERVTDSCLVYGHSMGALLAFELAHRLVERNGRAPAHLVVSGCAPPRAPRPAARLRHRLDDDELVRELVALGAAPEPWAEPEIRAVALPPLRADLAMAELFAYTSRPPLGCPITAVAGERDTDAPTRTMYGWFEETTAGFKVRTVPSGHYMLESHLADAAAVIGECLGVRPGRAPTAPATRSRRA